MTPRKRTTRQRQRARKRVIAMGRARRGESAESAYVNGRLHQGDVITWLQAYEGKPFHAIIADPPYALISISKRFGKPESAPAQFGRDGAFARASRGFMGQTWDGWQTLGEYQAWVTEWASLLLSVVYPGALLAMFGGTRTWHRLACGLEDAGWEVFDTLMYCYGNGFPKSHDISKAIDKAAGAEREVMSEWRTGFSGTLGGKAAYGGLSSEDVRTITAPATDDAQAWDGYGTSLKPSYEPIILARAPRQGYTYAKLATDYGTAALNIAQCRITPTSTPAAPVSKHSVFALSPRAHDTPYPSHEPYLGFLQRIVFALRSCNTGDTYLSHNAVFQDGNQPSRAECERLVSRLYPNGAWCGLDWSSLLSSQDGYQSYSRSCGELIHDAQVSAQASAPSLADALERICRPLSEPSYSHEKSYSDHPSSADDLSLISAFCTLLSEYILPYSAPPFQYEPNYKNGVYGSGMGGGGDKNPPLSSGRWPANLIFDAESAALLDSMSGERSAGSNVNGAEPSGAIWGNAGRVSFDGYGDTGGASRFFYTAKADSAERQYPDGDDWKRLSHPTVKPLDLTRWLATLLLPPSSVGERRLLVPFAGVGSEMIGAHLAGWESVTGVEQSAEYVEQGRQRLAWWREQKSYEAGIERIKSIQRGNAEDSELVQAGQLPLFAADARDDAA